MRVTVITAPHPLTDEHKTVEVVVLPEGASAIDLPEPPLAEDRAILINDEVPESVDALVLHDGDVVEWRAVAGKEFIGPILAIGATLIAGPLGAALGLGTVGTALLSAGLALGASFVAGLLIGPSGQPVGDTADADVDHSLDGGSNASRRSGSMPLIFGTVRFYPDAIVPPYREFLEGDQVRLLMGLGLGLGTVRVDHWQVGQDDATARGVTVNTPPSSELHNDTLTLSSGEIPDPPQEISTDLGSGVVIVVVDLEGRLYRLDNRNRFREQEVEVTIRVSTSGGARIHSLTTSIAGDKTTPTRRTVQLFIPDANRDDMVTCVVTRSDEAEETSKKNSRLFASIRRVSEDEGDYSAYGRASVIAVASAQNQGTLPAVRCIATGYIPVWDGSAWTEPRNTSNPAFISRAMILGGNGYGAHLSEDDIDVDKLIAWAARCQAANLFFDYEFRRPISIGDALTLVARAGQASWTIRNGKITWIFQDPDDTPVAAVGPANIFANSLRVTYETAPAPDSVEVRFVDPGADWQQRSHVETFEEGVANPTRPKLTLRGVITARHALRIAKTQGAIYQHLRRRISWAMGPEGRLLPLGAVVYLTHGILDGGDTGRLGPATREHYVDLGVPTQAGDMVVLYSPEGNVHTLTVTAGGGTGGAIAAQVPDDALQHPRDAMWMLHSSLSDAAKVRLTGHEALPDKGYRLIAVDEKQEYYDAQTVTDEELAGYIAARQIPGHAASQVQVPDFNFDYLFDLTPTRWMYQGLWEADTAYEIDDLVRHKGRLWLALEASTNVEPGTDATKWANVTEDGKGGAELVFKRTNTNANPGAPATTDAQDATADFVPTGWVDNPPDADSVNRWVWASIRQGTGPGTWGKFGTPALWAIWGQDGAGQEFVFKRAATNSAPAKPTTNAAQDRTNDFVPATFTDRPRGPTATLPFEFGYERKFPRGGTKWGKFSDGFLWGIFSTRWRFEGMWSNSTAYDRDDLVRHKGKLWLALAASTGVEPGTDATKWANVTEDGKGGPELIFRRTNTSTRPSAPTTTSAQDATADFVPTGWVDNPPDADSVNRWVWASIRQGTGPGTWGKFGTPALWAIWGQDGAGQEFVFKRAATNSAPAKPTTNAAQDRTNDFVPATFTDRPRGPTATLPFEFGYERKFPRGGTKWGKFGSGFLWGVFSRDGIPEQSIYRRTTDSTPPARPASSTTQKNRAAYVPTGWTATPTGVDEDNPYEWVCIRKKGSGTLYGDFSTPALWATFSSRDALIPWEDVVVAAGEITSGRADDAAPGELTTTMRSLIAAPAITLREGESVSCFFNVCVNTSGNNGAVLESRRGTHRQQGWDYRSDEFRSFQPNFIAVADYAIHGAGPHVLSLWGRSQNTRGSHTIVFASYHLRRYAKDRLVNSLDGSLFGSSDPAGSTRQVTFYQRGATAPAAPTSTAFSAYTTPGGGWSTSKPGATATLNVYSVVLTQSFSSSTQDSSTFTGNTWGGVTKIEDATGGSTSTRQRTFYQRGATAPAAPTSAAFGAYTSPGGGWALSKPGATATLNVYSVVLTQSFSSSTQDSSTFTGNTWGGVTKIEDATGGSTTSTRRRTFYQRGATASAAPTSAAFGAFTSPGGGWALNNPGATATLNVYSVVLTQSFSSGTQDSSTFTGNTWGGVTKIADATGTAPVPTNLSIQQFNDGRPFVQANTNSESVTKVEFQTAIDNNFTMEVYTDTDSTPERTFGGGQFWSPDFTAQTYSTGRTVYARARSYVGANASGWTAVVSRVWV